MAKAKLVDGRAHCVGRRKNSVARVYLERNGEGKININGKEAEDYLDTFAFTESVINEVVNKPFQVTNTMNQFNVEAKVEGGGYRGQIEALRHGIARALTAIDDDYRKDLKQDDLLTRDPRMVERKKYGKHKARRGQQFSKR
mgnify:CR=1 FL=1